MKTLFIYNPTCDIAVENSTNSYMPPKLLSKFEEDISPLMAFIGDKNDVVLSRNEASNELKRFWKQAGVDLPEFINPSEGITQDVSMIYPWGWSQIIWKQYQAIINKQAFHPDFSSLKDFRNLYSRNTSLKLQKKLYSKTLDPFVVFPVTPQAYTSIDKIENFLKNNASGIVLKTLWSSSGRGVVFIRNTQQLKEATNWIISQIQKHTCIIGEPIYKKVQDASLQFMITPNKEYQFMGINYFDADDQGRFNKEYLHTPSEIIKYLPQNDIWIQSTANCIIECFQELNIHNNYQGPIGVDAMFIEDNKGDVKFYPLVEANLRCNMGLVNLELKKHFSEGAKGTWQISTFKKNEAKQFYNQQLKQYPIELCNGKISKGFFPLTGFNSNTTFAAWGRID